MRKPIIAGNWKMNNTPDEAKALIEELIPLVKDAKCDVVVCPTYVCPVSYTHLGYMVFQQSEHRDEAMAFLKWFSENNASLWSEGGVSAFPVRTSFLKGIDTLKEPLTKAPFVEYIIPNSIQTVYPCLLYTSRCV